MSDLPLIKAVLLGAIQGATEFLPVSSSGHLVIAQHILGVRMENGGLAALDICLHLGTLVAVIIALWRDIVDIVRAFVGCAKPTASPSGANCLTPGEARRIGLFIIIGTVPAAFFGFLFKDFFESLFDNAIAAAAMLLVTGAILFGTRFVRGREIGASGMKWWHALVVGLAQAVAIVPGISRSGSTIAGGLYLGLTRDLAARFAFLLSIPAIAGAAVLEVGTIRYISANDVFAVAVGTVISAVVGFICVKWMLGIVRRQHFSWFAYYCWGVGLAALVYFIIR